MQNPIHTGVGSAPWTPPQTQSVVPSYPCRHCGTVLRHLMLDLGKSPLANSFVAADRRDEPEPFYPLRAWVCDQCWLVQIPEFARAEGIFSDYLYFSSFSRSWLEECRIAAGRAIERQGLGRGSFVVELASNDGYLLKNFVEAGVPCLGVEPAANVAEVAVARGIPTLVGFFGRTLAQRIRDERGPADLVIGINVLAHVPDVNDFVGGIATLLADDGIGHLEFPHLLHLLRDGLFDTIYHEHFSYFSLLAVDRILASQGLRAFDVLERPTHGGSLRLFVCKEGAPHQETAALRAVRQAEADFGMAEKACYDALAPRARKVRDDLIAFLVEQQRLGKTVAGYGAPAKGNTLLNYCGVKSDLLPMTVDLSIWKQGRYLPGTDIPIHNPEALERNRPDFVLVLPWNLLDEIRTQLAPIRALGTKLVVALPTLQILD